MVPLLSIQLLHGFLISTDVVNFNLVIYASTTMLLVPDGVFSS